MAPMTDETLIEAEEKDLSMTPYTFLFQYGQEKSSLVSKTESKTYNLYSDESKTLHQAYAPSRPPLENNREYLSFVPTEKDGGIAVRASSGDLLLVSEPGQFRKLFICNALTRKFMALPGGPAGCRHQIPFRISLVCREDDSGFKVVMFYAPDQVDPTGIEAVLFCSKTWRWRISRGEAPINKLFEPSVYESLGQSYPWNDGVAVVARNGTIHFLVVLSPTRRRLIVAFDPFLRRWNYLSPPPETSRAYDLSLGTTRDRLRLVDVSYSSTMKVWEFETPSPSWRLVSESCLEDEGMSFAHVLGFHPEEENVVFVYCDVDDDGGVWEYDVAEKKKIRRIGESPIRVENCPRLTCVDDGLLVFPMVHQRHFPEALISLF